MGTPLLPYISDAALALARQLWDDGADKATVAKAVGCSPGRLFDRGLINRPGKGRPAHPSLEHDPLPRRQGRGGGRKPGEAYDPRDPSAEEITQACKQIRSGWDEATLRNRKYQGAPDLQTWKASGLEVDAAVRRSQRQGDNRHADPRNRPW